MIACVLVAVAWIDVALVGDDYEMLVYRSSVISKHATRLVAVQQSVTYSGKEKAGMPIAVQEAVARNVNNFTLVLASLSNEERYASSPWVREYAHRRFVFTWLQAHFPHEVVHISDCDEIIDPQRMSSLARRPCVHPNLYFSYYSPFCDMNALSGGGWTDSVIAWTNSTRFRQYVARSGGSRTNRDGCPRSQSWDGWHLSYHMATPAIRKKLRSFSHAGDAIVKRGTDQMSDSAIETRIQRCGDLFARGVDGKVRRTEDHFPPPGFPMHPRAPTHVAAAAKI